MRCGKEYPIPADSAYQVRFYEGNKTRYATVGADYEAAFAPLGKYLASRQLEAAQEALGIVTPESAPETPKTLAESLREYIDGK